jgi:hypothetical protein
LKALRGILPAALLGLALLTGCGEDEPGSGDPPAVEAATPADQRIADELLTALDAADSPIDSRLLPPKQLAEIGPILDNLGEIYVDTDVIAVSGGDVVVRTSLEPNEESEVTATLICGAILDAGGNPEAVVLGAGPEGDTELRTCERGDRNFP